MYVRWEKDPIYFRQVGRRHHHDLRRRLGEHAFLSTLRVDCRYLICFVKPRGEQVTNRIQRLGRVVASRGQRQLRPLRGTQRQNRQDALTVNKLPRLANLNVCLKLICQANQHIGGPRVQALWISNRDCSCLRGFTH